MRHTKDAILSVISPLSVLESVSQVISDSLALRREGFSHMPDLGPKQDKKHLKSWSRTSELKSYIIFITVKNVHSLWKWMWIFHSNIWKNITSSCLRSDYPMFLLGILRSSPEKVTQQLWRLSQRSFSTGNAHSGICGGDVCSNQCCKRHSSWKVKLKQVKDQAHLITWFVIFIVEANLMAWKRW